MQILNAFTRRAIAITFSDDTPETVHRAVHEMQDLDLLEQMAHISYTPQGYSFAASETEALLYPTAMLEDMPEDLADWVEDEENFCSGDFAGLVWEVCITTSTDAEPVVLGSGTSGVWAEQLVAAINAPIAQLAALQAPVVAPTELALLDQSIATEADALDGQEAHLDNSTCPHCGGDHIEGGSIEIDHLIASQACTCNDCDAEWNELYSFTGRTDLVYCDQ